MPLTSVHIKGYRSVQSIRFPVDDLTVFVGRNGVGKTNLYRALQFLQAAADGTISRKIAVEGGMESILWAGTRRRKEPVRLVLAAEFDTLEYSIEIGLPPPRNVSSGQMDPAFNPDNVALSLDPLIKEEEVAIRVGKRRVVMMRREGPAVWMRDEDGKRIEVPERLLASETALFAIRDVGRYPEVEQVRRELLDWRFYHQVRTDPDSPVRKPQFGIATPTLSSDGNDLAAVLATVYYIARDAGEIEAAVEDAFPGSRLIVDDIEGRCRFAMVFPDMDSRRRFEAHELSDGTLCYLALIGALCAHRLPSFIALNEPESSLHPSLIPPLARLIANASLHTRIWVVTHSEPLAEALAGETGVLPRRIEKQEGATWIEGLSQAGHFADC